MRMLVVTDKKGRVIGATHTPPANAEITWGFVTTNKDQVLHEVDIPDHLSKLDPDERLQRALEHEIPAGKKELRLRAAKKTAAKKR